MSSQKDRAHLPLYYLIVYFFFHEVRDGIRFDGGLVWSAVDGRMEISDRPFSPSLGGAPKVFPVIEQFHRLVCGGESLRCHSFASNMFSLFLHSSSGRIVAPRFFFFFFFIGR